MSKIVYDVLALVSGLDQTSLSVNPLGGYPLAPGSLYGSPIFYYSDGTIQTPWARLSLGTTSKVTVVTGSLTLTPLDRGIILIDASAGDIVVTLPLAADSMLFDFIFHRIDSTTNTALVQRASGSLDTIDTLTTPFYLETIGSTKAITSDGTIRWITDSMVNSELVQTLSGRTRTMLNSPYLREWINVTVAPVGYIMYGTTFNANILDPIGTPSWAGRDATGMCWLEKWDAQGNKETWSAVTGNLGDVPTWVKVASLDAKTGRMSLSAGTVAGEALIYGQGELLANKATDFSTVNDTLYPSIQAVKTYADGLVVGLFDDRGNFDASVNTFPTTGGSGIAGALVKGDVWTISVAATAGPLFSYIVGTTIRVLTDTPGQTPSNWAITTSTTLSDLAPIIHNAAVKTVLVDADEVAVVDSENLFSLVRTSFASLKASIKTAFDLLYTPIAYSKVVHVTGATTILESDSGSQVFLDGGGTYTVALPTTPADGTRYKIYGNDMGIVTIDTGMGILYFPSNVTTSSYVISNAPNQGITVIYDSYITGWKAETFGKAKVYHSLEADDAVSYTQLAGSQIPFDMSYSLSAGALSVFVGNPLSSPIAFFSDLLSDATVNMGILPKVPVSLTLTLGSTLGLPQGVAGKIAILLLKNGGTYEVGVTNLTGTTKLDETGVVSTTAISAGATSANTIYSTSTIASTAFRVIGYITLTQTVSGTWEAPTKHRSIGGVSAVEPTIVNVVHSATDTAFKDADEFVMLDSANGFNVVKTTGTALKSAIKSWYDAVASTLTNKTINLTSNTLVATSAQVNAAVSDNTGTGLLVFNESPAFVSPDLGTPSAGIATNLSGVAPNLTAGHVTTNADLTGPITSVGNATSVASQTGTGSKFVMDTNPILVNPNVGVAVGVSFNLITGLSAANPVMAGAATPGTSNVVSREDHVHPSDTTRASQAELTAAVAGLWDDRGVFDASVNNFPTAGGSGALGAISKADVWTISVVATSGPLLGYAVGTVVRALVDAPGQTIGNWTLLNSSPLVADVIGLWDDRGSFDASINTYPTTGGSGTAGAILRADVFTVSVVATAGDLLGYGLGSIIRARTDTPGQTAGNWALMNATPSGGGGGPAVETDLGVGANIDLALSHYYKKTVTADITFTNSNVQTAPNVSDFVLTLYNGGAWVITWWAGVKWPSGTAPILTVTGKDTLGFFTSDGGVTWNGLLLGKDIK